jgi:hypothetical protein
MHTPFLGAREEQWLPFKITIYMYVLSQNIYGQVQEASLM